MTIKVSDLNSLAVGQETFHHQYFQRGRPDLLKNLQRRSTDNKNSKKRKKPRTDGDFSYLQGRVESLEETAKEMMATIKQMRNDSFTSAAAIRDLQSLNARKDEKISALEKRIVWLERQLSTSGLQRDSSFINPGQRLQSGDIGGMKGWHQTQDSAPVAAFGSDVQQQGLYPPTSVTFPNNITTGAIGDSNGPTLARHPKMKKFVGNAPKDIFSYENATNVSNNNPMAGAVPSREPSLDFGLLSSLARESSLMSWMPRQDAEKNLP